MQICIESQLVQPGDIFIPLSNDPKEILTANEKGARQILNVNLLKYAAKYRKNLNCLVIAFAGSWGKTTIKNMLYYILSQKFLVAKNSDQYENKTDLALSILKADFKTEILLLDLELKTEKDLSNLAKLIRPNWLVVNNLGIRASNNLKTLFQIAQATAKVFRPKLSWEKKERFAFLNHSSFYYDYLQKKASRQGYKIRPFGGAKKMEQNIALSYLIAENLGLTQEQIENGLAEFQEKKFPLKKFSVSQINFLVDLANLEIDDLIFACEYLNHFKNRKILVLGSKSNNKKLNRKILDAAIDNEIAFIYTYGPVKKFKSKKIPIYHFFDQQSLAKELLLELKKEDLVLIKGEPDMHLNNIIKYIQQNYA